MHHNHIGKILFFNSVIIYLFFFVKTSSLCLLTLEPSNKMVVKAPCLGLAGIAVNVSLEFPTWNEALHVWTVERTMTYDFIFVTKEKWLYQEHPNKKEEAL